MGGTVDAKQPVGRQKASHLLVASVPAACSRAALCARHAASFTYVAEATPVISCDAHKKIMVPPFSRWQPVIAKTVMNPKIIMPFIQGMLRNAFIAHSPVISGAHSDSAASHPKSSTWRCTADFSSGQRAINGAAEMRPNSLGSILLSPPP